MTSPRNFLLIALLFIGYLLWMQWQEDYDKVPATTAGAPAAAVDGAPTAPVTVPDGADVPSASGSAAPAPSPATPDAAANASGERVVVTTDVLRVEIDTRGGNVVVADLLAYPLQPKDYAHPKRLLDSSAAGFFVAQSGLVSAGGAAPDHQAQYSAEKNAYSLADGSDTIEVPLSWSDASGIAVRKVFVFKRGSYVIDQRQEISNKGGVAWSGNAYRQLQRVPPVIDTSGIKGYSNIERYSFVGAAWYSPADKFQKLKFDQFAKEPLDKPIADGWAAMLQHYFFAAWIPAQGENDQYSTKTYVAHAADGSAANRYLIRTQSPPISVAPGATYTDAARLYVGPKLQSTLDQIAPGLSLTVDYGMFTVIAEPLHWLLAQLHKLTGNWGFAIILLVLIIKALFFKLSETQYRSGAKMRKLQPRMQALKERYGDDRQKMNMAMMELYQKEKVNPLAGCLPMLVQIPVFFALYWVLLESVELRQAPFIGWIQNLTAPDPYYVLPVLNGLVMIATTMLTPSAGMDPTQAKMMKIMPVVFSVLFAFFPAGLVLYYTVNGGLGLLQQWIITRRIDAGEKAAAA
ncbi:membrane protein insertase YidC [Dokdonella fugitiva]|jgi:YidC/Oxa1 family membrane protein insertase|uniref:Membrane protein insertase YidC n=1 Tax=Dokdonella fugitiva TaxID=328517 RepID=A0A4R2IL27_9GAMM|nr:membrane protein insertase YidC [Dokdonella fugitiva]TCO43415.1 YidC/Oxa1 family membrane protein insertase [Dokdonella fugitiva]